VLAGWSAAFSSQGLDPLSAAGAAGFVHGRAGELAGRDIWGQGVLARDVAAQVPAALAQLRGAGRQTIQEDL
jgi:NAD(P)H-hydrate repair Nnr-like enzyme with NAD(P)H-hydrate dehydratase domain